MTIIHVAVHVHLMISVIYLALSHGCIYMYAFDDLKVSFLMARPKFSRVKSVEIHFINVVK